MHDAALHTARDPQHAIFHLYYLLYVRIHAVIIVFVIAVAVAVVAVTCGIAAAAAAAAAGRCRLPPNTRGGYEDRSSAVLTQKNLRRVPFEDAAKSSRTWLDRARQRAAGACGCHC